MQRDRGRRLRVRPSVISEGHRISSVRSDLADHDTAQPLDLPVYLARLHQDISSD
jgi:hypothetical protein